MRPATDPDSATVIDQLGALLPPTGRESMSIVEIKPRGHYVTYGVGVRLLRMRDPTAARARVQVGEQ